MNGGIEDEREVGEWGLEDERRENEWGLDRG